MTQTIPGGTAHSLPDDVKKMLQSDAKILELWEGITPLARNEWLCWMTSGARVETRAKRIAVGKSKMQSGEQRPCCWQGCPHREGSNTAKYFKKLPANNG